VFRKLVKHINEPGHAHELTFSCFQRLPLLSCEAVRDFVLEAVGQARDRLGFLLHAYVVMPEHVHLLLLPRKQSFDVAWVLKAVKQSVARRAKAWLLQNDPPLFTKLTPGGVGFRFWTPGGGYDRNVTESRTLRGVIQYIHENPVRRGLVEKPTDWKWSSALWYEERTGPLRVDLVEG
jgi:putative transposase